MGSFQDQSPDNPLDSFVSALLVDDRPEAAHLALRVIETAQRIAQHLAAESEDSWLWRRTGGSQSQRELSVEVLGTNITLTVITAFRRHGGAVHRFGPVSPAPGDASFVDPNL